MINKIKKQYIQGKNFLAFSFLKITGQGLEMLAPLIIAGMVSPEFFGKYSLAKMIIFFFSSLFIASSSTPFIVYANKEKKISGKINESFSLQLIIIILAVISFLILMFSFPTQLKTFAGLSTIELYILFPAFIGITIKLLGENLLLALDKKLKHSLVGIIFGLSVVLLTFFSFLSHLISFQFIFIIYFISGVLTFFIFYKIFRSKNLRPFKINRILTKSFLSFTSWQMMGLTAVYFINWGDNLVLRYFVSMKEIGVYNLGYQVFKGLISATFIISTYFMPFIIKNIKNKEQIRNYLYKKRPRIVTASLFLLILFYFLIPKIFNIFYESEYHQSAQILQILIIPLIFHLLTVFYIPIINSLEKYKFTQITNVLAILINLTLNILLIKKFGIFGAALSTTFAYLFVLISYSIFAKRINIV